MALVYLDAGHGGYDNGAVFQGRKEKDDNLELTLAVGEVLEQNGVDVGYTRVTDVYDSPVRKAQIANEANADYFVSFHRNSSPVPNTYSGVQSLVYDNSGIKARMANEINEELEEVGFNNLGISVRPDLAVLRATQMPAVLVEAGFINTEADNALFDEKFDEIAEGIANGIYKTIYGTDLPNGNMDDVLYPPGNRPTPQPPTVKEYYVQTGLFRNYANAVALNNRLQGNGYPSMITQNGEYYAVVVGPYRTKQDGSYVEEALRQQGYDTLLVLR